MQTIHQSSRRKFLKAGGIVLATAAVGAAVNLLAKEEEEKSNDVSPPEDLMREHGVLKRILLIYGEALRRMDANEDLPPEPLAESAKIIREFVEDYHEKLEENFLFPRFRKAKKLVDLVEVLLQQHQAGRRLTDITMHLATGQALKNPDDRRNLADSMRQFIRMYSPHEAREDTVLFPAFSGIVSPPTSSTRKAKISRKKKTSYSARTVFSRSWITWRRSKKNWASMISRNSRQNCKRKNCR